MSDSDPKELRCAWCEKADERPNGTLSVVVLSGVRFCSKCLVSAVLRKANRHLTKLISDQELAVRPRSR